MNSATNEARRISGCQTQRVARCDSLSTRLARRLQGQGEIEDDREILRFGVSLPRVHTACQDRPIWGR